MSGVIETLQIDQSGQPAFRRVMALLLPTFLVAGLLILVADRADASSARAGSAAAAVAASGATATASASAGAQFSIRAIVCPILLALRGLLPFLGGIIDALLVAFGCTTPSGPVVPPDDDDDDDDD